MDPTSLIGTLVDNSPLLALLVLIGWAGYRRMWVWGSYYEERDKTWQERYQELGKTWKERYDEKAIEAAEYKSLAFNGSMLLKDALQVAKQQTPLPPPPLTSPGPAHGPNESP